MTIYLIKKSITNTVLTRRKGEVAGMGKVTVFSSVRLHVSGWVRLDKLNFNLCRRVCCKVNPTVEETEQSVISARRHPSQFLQPSSETIAGSRRRIIITTRPSSDSQTATRTTTTRIMRTTSVVCGDEASPFLLF